ncbi:hypothetical protein [Citricoccus sp. NR2]|uniref:hypothetical protein n=1 Tax=Citricoccus sp. NR2 TaxID=3004095 RepID=UPI0022DE9154|nr:hypothetical protein [Citricoccus sp. NR2]WBL18525.1 hypothetical protein O1A05_12260 [Citricoccus sp. NR2]
MSELSPREKRSIDELYGILAGYRREIDRIARAQDTRLTTLGPNDAINFVDGEGKPVARIGGSGAYGYSSDLVQYLDGPIPDAPGEPLIEGGAGVIRVTLGDGAEPADARLCRVHASLEADFVPSYATVVGSLIPGTSTVAISIQAGTWHCCVQWLTLSGKESEVSPVVSVEVDPMVDMSDLDDARAEADQKWAEFAVREQEYQDAIADAKARIKAAEDLFESMPEPLELETAVQRARDAVEALGDVTQQLETAETTIETNAQEAAENLGALEHMVTGDPGYLETLWSRLTVTERLQAVEAFIGGAMIGDNEITVGKIQATRELITKIFSADIGLVNELIVQGNLFANHVTALNAALQNLSVTEKANFVDAFADTFWANDFVARVATMSRAIVAAPNLLPGVDFTQASDRISIASGRFVYTSFWGGFLFRGAGTEAFPERFTLSAGETYRIKIESMAQSAGALYRFRVLSQDSGGVVHSMTGESGGWGDWVGAEGTFSVPATGVYYAQLQMWLGHGAQPPSSSQTEQVFRSPSIRSLADGQFLVDGTVQARKLQADEIWANSTWQNEAYFGSSDATYQTRVNGQGLEVLRTDDSGENIPAVALGGGELGLNFWDADGNSTGSITHDGQISGEVVSSREGYLLGGQDLLGDLADSRNDGAVLDTLSRSEVSYGYRNMANLSLSSSNAVIFMEGEARHVAKGRSYLINIGPFSVNEDVSMFLDLKATLDGSAPVLASPTIGILRVSSRSFQGSIRYTPESDGILRVGLQLRRSGTGISFPSSFAEVRMSIFDMGLASSGTGMPRNSYSGNPDAVGLTRDYHTSWTPTWYQTYQNGAQYTWPIPLQGRHPSGTIYSSQVGGYTSALSVGGVAAGENGRTIAQALSGAELITGTLTVTLRASPAASGGNIRPYWHTNNTSPATFNAAPPVANRVGPSAGIPVSSGSRAMFNLPQACLDAIKNGTFRGFSFHPTGSQQPYFALEGVDAKITDQPILRLRYHR